MSVNKKGKEPSEVLLRRFNREIQLSGIFIEVKKRRFFSNDLSRKTRRNSAIRKSHNKSVKRGY